MSHKMLVALTIFGTSDVLRGDYRKNPEPMRARRSGLRAKAGASRRSPLSA